MSKPYRFGTAPQGGFDPSNRISNRLARMQDLEKGADVPSWVGESGPAVKVTDRTEWVDVDLDSTSIDPIITPDVSNSHSASDSDDDNRRSSRVSRNGSTRSPKRDDKRNDEPLELESPRNRSDDLSITLVFMLVSVMVMASSIVGMGVSMISGFNILNLLTYGFTGVASTILFGESLGDLGKIYNVRRSPGEKFLDWVRRLGKTMGMESEGLWGSSGPSTRARHRHKVKMVSGVMGDPYVLEDDDPEEHDDGVIAVKQLEDKTAHGVTEIIDSWTNALSRVGLDSRTGDMMDRVADYWYMAVDAIDSMDDLKVMVAEVVEPVSALGDVVSMYVKMRKSSRLYSEKELDDAKVMLVDAENSMIEVFRKAARRSLDATRSKAESSLGYLKSKRDGDPVIQEVNESISGGKPYKTGEGEIVGTSKNEDSASGTSTHDTIGELASRASSEVGSKENGVGAGVIASPGL